MRMNRILKRSKNKYCWNSDKAVYPKSAPLIVLLPLEIIIK
jgi:hypothetical protein